MFDDETIEAAVEQPVVEESAPVVEQPAPAPQPAPESQAERNFRTLVEKNKRIERERDEALRKLQERETPAPVEEPEEEINLGSDEIAEGKHIKSLMKEIRKTREELKQYKQASTVMSEEAILKASYPDIEKVVSKDNMNLLREQDPEFVELLDTSTNFKAKVISAYKKIKALGIHVDDTYQADRDLAQKNASKPKPLASVSPQQGDSPLSRANAFANGLTPELKTQLIREMEDARKNR